MALRTKVRILPRLIDFRVGHFQFAYYFVIRNKNGSGSYTKWHLTNDDTMNTSDVMTTAFDIIYDSDNNEVKWEGSGGTIDPEYWGNLYFYGWYAFTEYDIPSQTFTYPDTNEFDLKTHSNFSNVQASFERELHNNRPNNDDYDYYGLLSDPPDGFPREFTIIVKYNLVVKLVDHLYVDDDTRTVTDEYTVPITMTMVYRNGWSISSSDNSDFERSASNFRDKLNVGVLLFIDMDSIETSITFNDN